VTGLVHPERMITNAGAKEGDILILTKPLGTGILTTGIKKGLVPDGELANRAVQLMATLNRPGSLLAERALVQCATDITGFGLLGHLLSLCRSSGVRATLRASEVPVIDPEILKLIDDGCVPGGTKENWRTAEPHLQVSSGVSTALTLLLADAQTSGGLLCCVPEANLSEVQTIFTEEGTLTQAVIGQITSGAGEDPALIRIEG
ncbi:MAG: selenide, water dikinase SelD, partial [Verrucomicrobiota bacterium]